MLKHAVLALLAVSLFCTGCGPSTPDVFTNRFAPMSEGLKGSFEGAVNKLPDYYDANVTVRETATGTLRTIRLYGEGGRRRFKMTDLPPGKYEAYAELAAKPDLPAPPADQVPLLPTIGYEFEITPYALERTGNFHFPGEVRDATEVFPRSFLWGKIYNVPKSYDVILTLSNPSYTFRKRIKPVAFGPREWTMDEIPVADYLVAYRLVHRRGKSFTRPGQFVPATHRAVNRPARPREQLITHWTPVDVTDKPASISGTVTDVPDGVDVIVVASRSGMEWKAYGPRYTLHELAPGAYVVSVRLWDPARQQYVEQGMTDPPTRQVVVKPGEKLRSVDFRWLPDTY